MFGNLLNVCGVTERLSKTAQNELMNIVTIFLGLTVGATASADNFLKGETLLIIFCGLVAFIVSTIGGVAYRKNHERSLRRQNQSANRFRRRICCSHGSPCISKSGSGIRSF